MKRSEIRPCDSCGGPVGMVFHAVQHSLVVVDMGAVRQNEAMRIMFPGAPAIAASFSLDDIATVAGEKDPEMWTKLVLCMNCYAGLDRTQPLCVLVEKRNEAVRVAEERKVEAKS